MTEEPSMAKLLGLSMGPKPQGTDCISIAFLLLLSTVNLSNIIAFFITQLLSLSIISKSSSK